MRLSGWRISSPKQIEKQGASNLKVCALVSEWGGPGSISGRRFCVVFLGRTFILTVPLSTQVYNIGTGELNVGR